jgi:hypothetical protein
MATSSHGHNTERRRSRAGLTCHDW